MNYRAILFCLFAGISSSAIAGDKPNVVLMLADNLGYGDLTV